MDGRDEVQIMEKKIGGRKKRIFRLGGEREGIYTCRRGGGETAKSATGIVKMPSFTASTGE